MVAVHVVSPTQESKPNFRRIAEIQRAVAEYYGIPLIELLSDRRARSRQRQVAMFLCRELTPHTLVAIGSAFDRDISTIIHGVRMITHRIGKRNDTMLATDIQRLKSILA